MNKKYIDFVPVGPQDKGAVAKTGKKSVSKPVKPAKAPSTVRVAKPVKTQASKAPRVVQKKAVTKEDVLDEKAETFSLKKEPAYGVVEDYRPKFVKTEVKKRPLSQSHFAVQQSELVAAKSAKVGATKRVNKSEAIVEKPVEKSDVTENIDKNKMPIPKPQFINQGKVQKRPLSKNVYERAVQPTEEKPTGPVTIISKPEKNSKISIVVTIILTIILGAAAGTIAFLLLPK